MTAAHSDTPPAASGRAKGRKKLAIQKGRSFGYAPLARAAGQEDKAQILWLWGGMREDGFFWRFLLRPGGELFVLFRIQL